MQKVIRFFAVGLFFLLVAPMLHAALEHQADPLLYELRSSLQQVFEDEEECERLYQKVKDLQNPTPIVKGYIGTIYIAKARHVPIFKKMRNFNKGTDLLETAIKEAPSDVELRFLRLTIQVNLPGFLGYNKNIDTDKNFLVNKYHTAGPRMKEAIIDYINNSGEFSADQRAQVRS